MIHMKRKSLYVCCLLLVGVSAFAQVNDSNTPLHLMTPQYQTGYGVSTVADVKETMDRVLSYISAVLREHERDVILIAVLFHNICHEGHGLVREAVGVESQSEFLFILFAAAAAAGNKGERHDEKHDQCYDLFHFVSP